MRVMKTALRRFFQTFGRRTDIPFEVRLADGTNFLSRPQEPALRLVFRNRRAEWNSLLYGHIGLMESYFNGDLEVEGDLRQAFRFGMESRMPHRPFPLVRLRNRFHELRHSNRSWRTAKANARFHYGLGTEFYRRWLDTPLMMYTCAYWPQGTETLEEAQRNKVEHVCRKIRLGAGERFVDIGCGFGGMLFHAYERHGALGTGVNTATEQVDFVRGEIRRRGLEGRVAVREADFRDVDGPYDKVVSIGVLEHAGRDQLAAVIKAHADFLKPGGLGMLHFIGHLGERETEFFVRRHVFPGGWIPSLARTLSVMQELGLEVLDIENLRRHYALTLDRWAERFESRWEEIHAIDPRRFDERFRRIWRSYLVGCAELFRSPATETNLFQITFSKGMVRPQGYPMTRDFLYRGGESP
jgi:cyclopropane-fatty-acyl-phospholipid synthase